MRKDIKYLTTRHITGVIDILSGLHIGAGNDAIEIGGIDNPVIKHPLTGEPYIPGSSLKGKLRSLLEWSLGKIEEDGKVWGSDGEKNYEDTDPVLRIFGTSHKKWQGGPTRLMVRDAFLNPDWLARAPFETLSLEEKAEVTIDRIQGKARNGGLRQTERVPAGAQFQMELIFKVFSIGEDEGATDLLCLNRLLEAMKLLEQDALGGSGSRGYGRICFCDLKLDKRDIQDSFDAIEHFDKEKPIKIVTGVAA
ncbi:CRISPR-associated RAMP protein, Csm3 family [Nitrosococcus halophilus Nc 4]|uniref:CRISPR system Cms endoribonuclease Csm3 n=1 Tax=Nitrosococcus halophilus (strain Nc4) TaxID=472759 RepID=D5BXY6_NITHN|nr:type III-A CRISPR-associated RAMP protein Csm3 [Nitrosococcus halophilus]ADE15897.1 CRISPR-associated RAMP protein, Csm3 family [Nitrosococcus halophilus Nc 4]